MLLCIPVATLEIARAPKSALLWWLFLQFWGNDPPPPVQSQRSGPWNEIMVYRDRVAVIEWQYDRVAVIECKCSNTVIHRVFLNKPQLNWMAETGSSEVLSG